ncbi:hypothetical protein [Mycoplasmopsis pullorum]|uniref:Uncharacterized protein n=1 Tax=Mycoplasmopsis pullorum TaxID=48003 RepID=A0A1L4FSU8_9BACT|nr:hypothetical protein [Mycoplasmopsis pullorum]APJ38697.1 hypothetical protein BLA55_03490 [Mycoplasmopsis pullorum]
MNEKLIKLNEKQEYLKTVSDQIYWLTTMSNFRKQEISTMKADKNIPNRIKDKVIEQYQKLVDVLDELIAVETTETKVIIKEINNLMRRI